MRRVVNIPDLLADIDRLVIDAAAYKLLEEQTLLDADPGIQNGNSHSNAPGDRGRTGVAGVKA